MNPLHFKTLVLNPYPVKGGRSVGISREQLLCCLGTHGMGLYPNLAFACLKPTQARRHAQDVSIESRPTGQRRENDDYGHDGEKTSGVATPSLRRGERYRCVQRQTGGEIRRCRSPARPRPNISNKSPAKDAKICSSPLQFEAVHRALEAQPSLSPHRATCYRAPQSPFLSH